MELEVQRFLRTGGTIDQLKENLGIKNNQSDKLVLLNYHQIDSPKTDPIVMNCRGIVLEKGSWNIVHFPFSRFFNHGEALNVWENIGGDEFYDSSVALEKIDGTLIGFWYYANKWNISTRGVLDASGSIGIGGEQTFNQLFCEVVDKYPNFWIRVDPKYTYTFELVSPKNRIVTPYKQSALYLLSMRLKETCCEVSYPALKDWSQRLGVSIPNIFEFHDISKLIDRFSDLNPTDEGFVCVNYTYRINESCWPRVKVKNPAYCAIAHIKDSSASSVRALLQLVMSGTESKFLSYFPEYHRFVDPLKTRYTNFINTVNLDWDKIKHLSKDQTREGRKNFAFHAKESISPSAMFCIYDGKAQNAQHFINLQIEVKGSKVIAKGMLKTLKIKDIEFEEE